MYIIVQNGLVGYFLVVLGAPLLAFRTSLHGHGVPPKRRCICINAPTFEVREGAGTCCFVLLYGEKT